MKLIILNAQTGFSTIIITIIIAFTTISILVFMSSFIIRYKRQINQQKEIVLIQEFQELFSEFLFSEDESLSSIKKFKPYTQNKFDKSILLKTLFKIRNDMTGDISDKLKMLYVELELDNDSIKKIKSTKWNIQIIGMRELSDMKIKKVAKDIAKLTLHPNKILRKEAQLALVKINGYEALNFLNTLTYPLSEWQQLLLLETIQYYKGDNLPPLEHLLKSENDSVILFVLKIIKIFNLFNLKDSIIQLLNHENEKIRIETIVLFGELQITDSLAILKRKYTKSTKAVKLKIIELFGEISDENGIPFLVEQLKIYDYENNLQVLRSILNIVGIQKLEELKPKLSTEQQPLLLHVIEEKN